MEENVCSMEENVSFMEENVSFMEENVSFMEKKGRFMDENCSWAGSRWRAAETVVAPAGTGAARGNLSRNVCMGVHRFESVRNIGRSGIPYL